MASSAYARALSDTSLWIAQLVVIQQREHDVARHALARGDKARALTALRKRKYQESLITKTDNQLETLENLVSSTPPRRTLFSRDRAETDMFVL